MRALLCATSPLSPHLTWRRRAPIHPSHRWQVCPIHSELPAEEQLLAFDPPPAGCAKASRP
eukprot:6640360-Prymnesium_polylepis.1